MKLLSKFKKIGRQDLASIFGFLNADPASITFDGCDMESFGETISVIGGDIEIMNGAHIVRVHNVKMAKDTIKVMDAVMEGKIFSI